MSETVRRVTLQGALETVVKSPRGRAVVRPLGRPPVGLVFLGQNTKGGDVFARCSDVAKGWIVETSWTIREENSELRGPFEVEYV